MQSGLRSIAIKLALLLAASVVAAVMLELIVVLVMGEQVKFPRRVVGAPWGLRINEPNSYYRHKSADLAVWFRINGQGMRSERDFSYEKPPDVIRIVSLGDSFTAGYEVEGDETFSSVLERELNARGHRVEVLNTGVSGYSNAEAYLYLERELWKYDPDIVLLSFYANDLVDNERTGLFRLEDGELVEAQENYVPAGALGNFLNTSAVFNLLSGYSNAFAFIKEQLTHAIKRAMVDKNVRNTREAEVKTAADVRSKDTTIQGGYGTESQRALAVGILDRLYESSRARGVPLVIQSIPQLLPANGVLLEAFPTEFDTEREGVHLLKMRGVLDGRLDEDLLYWRRSHYHWTPYSHRLSGEALANLVVEEGLAGK